MPCATPVTLPSRPPGYDAISWALTRLAAVETEVAGILDRGAEELTHAMAQHSYPNARDREHSLMRDARRALRGVVVLGAEEAKTVRAGCHHTQRCLTTSKIQGEGCPCGCDEALAILDGTDSGR